MIAGKCAIRLLLIVSSRDSDLGRFCHRSLRSSYAALLLPVGQRLAM
jgi:hypothetical protein